MLQTNIWLLKKIKFINFQNFLMATKAIEEKKQEMEATMVNLGDKVGSNIQQGLNQLPVAGVIAGSAGIMQVEYLSRWIKSLLYPN